MPRYFFHLHRDGIRYVDEEGQALSSVSQALEAANILASDLMDDEFGYRSEWLSCRLEVTDAQGAIVLEYPFLDAVPFRGRPS